MVAILDWILGIFIVSCMLAIGWGLVRIPHEAEKKDEEETESEGYWDAIGVELPDEAKWHTKEKTVLFTQQEIVEIPRTEQLMQMLFHRLEPWRQELLNEGFTLGNLILYEENDVSSGDVKITAQVWCIKGHPGQIQKVVKGKNDGIDPFWRMR